MNNALVKQSIRYVDTVLKGIHEIDGDKVVAGLKGLHSIDFNNVEAPLSPFFDLVKGISHGREDFLSLEHKHSLSVVIRHMAQGVYQWSQKKNKGVAHVTKDELTTSLEDLVKLLEPTKDPCISSITNLTCTKAIASCLSMPASSTNEWWDRLIFIGELIGDSLQFAAGITTAKVDTGFQAALSILQRLYKPTVSMYKILKNTNDQTLVMQIAAVNAWREIIHAGSNAKELPIEQAEKILESLKQYFEEGVKEEGETPTTMQKLGEAVGIKSKEVKDFISNLVKAFPYRKYLIEELYGENGKIAAIKDILKNLAADQDKEMAQDKEMIEALREVAFHALVDLYVETKRNSVRCEILKVFGELARCLCEQDSWSDERLSSLIGKKEKIDTIEEASFRILVEAVWPTVFKEKDQDKSVALSLTSRKAGELSKKWKIRCMAIEELLRFEDHYLKSKRDEGNKEPGTPVRSFLDDMGREYQVTVLLINKFKLDEGEIASLRDFLHHAKRMGEARELLKRYFPLREAEIDKLLKKDKDTVENFLDYSLGFTKDEIKALLKKEVMESITFKVRLEQNLNLKQNLNPEQNLNMELSDSDIGLISNILRGEVSQEKLATKEKSIKNWLGTKLNLGDEKCNTLIQFLQQEKDEQEQPQQEKYRNESVRPVLDELIDQFRLTQAERDLIDEAIFRGETKHSTQASMIEKVGEALKSFFGQDNYSNIACAFNNLDRIKKMIEAEKQLVGK